MNYNKLFVVSLIFPALFSCSGGGKGSASSIDPKSTRGQLVGVAPTKNWSEDQPKGMVKIPSGSFVMGQTDQDFTKQYNAEPKTVTVSAFYMDETEITNSEYLQFVYYTRDSITRTMLAENNVEGYTYLGEGDDDAKSDGSAYYEMLASKGSGEGYQKRLDWDAPLYWSTGDYPSVEYAEVLESMYIAPEERVEDDRFIDWSKLGYKYRYVDLEGAANAGKSRKEFVKEFEIPVYPDTTVWVKDFTYSYNEPMHEEYMWHSAYRDYPVVGVSWAQAMAFCSYRTKNATTYNKMKGKGKSRQYSLPTEAQWEYAARGGITAGTYPWGGPYLTDDRGCYLANFKPKRGNYMEDEKKGTWIYAAKVKSFPPNGFGLYDMAGNVSEWTLSPYDNTSPYASATMNPNLVRVGEKNAKKVIRGGSWKDVGHFLQVATRDWEYSDKKTSYIGFRTVQYIPDRVSGGSSSSGRSR